MGKKPEEKSDKSQGNVVSLAAVMCHVPKCSGKIDRMGFCAKHHEEYKFGLINQKGERPIDYEKKLEHFQLFQKSKTGKAA